MLVAYRLLDDARASGWRVVLGALLGVAALARAEALLLLPLLLIPLLRRPGGLKAAAVVVRRVRGRAGALDRAQLVGVRPARADRDRGRRDARRRQLRRDLLRRADRHLAVLAARTSTARGNEAKELNEAGHDGIALRARPPRAPARWSWPPGSRAPGALWQPFAVPEGRRAWVQQLGAAIYFVLIPLAVYGLVLLRRRRVPVLILLAPFVTVTVTALLAYGQIRFRHSAELSLVVLAAVALDRLLPVRAGRAGADRRAGPRTSTSQRTEAPYAGARLLSAVSMPAWLPGRARCAPPPPATWSRSACWPSSCGPPGRSIYGRVEARHPTTRSSTRSPPATWRTATATRSCSASPRPTGRPGFPFLVSLALPRVRHAR